MGIPSMLMQSRLRWLGHVHRMEPDRLPSEILNGELRDGARKVGRPLLRYKDTIKRDLKAVKINTNSWGRHRRKPRRLETPDKNPGAWS